MTAPVKPNSLKWQTQFGEVVVETLSKIVTIQGIECLNGGMARQNGKMKALWVRIDNKPELVVAVAAYKADWAAYNAATAAELAANVPGLEALGAALQAASNESERYDAEFAALMSGRTNGQAPTLVDGSYRTTANALAVTYPRAAMYLRAQGFMQSANMDKYEAGAAVAQLLTSGGDIDDAATLMHNWLPATATNN